MVRTVGKLNRAQYDKHSIYFKLFQQAVLQQVGYAWEMACCSPADYHK